MVQAGLGGEWSFTTKASFCTEWVSEFVLYFASVVCLFSMHVGL